MQSRPGRGAWWQRGPAQWGVQTGALGVPGHPPASEWWAGVPVDTTSKSW